jgi:hypothetical protein
LFSVLFNAKKGEGIMKKIFALTVAFIAGMAMTASAGSIGPGQMTKCNDAKSITGENAGPANFSNDKFGYTSNDRGSATVAVWKSSNFSTTSIPLGPNDNNDSLNSTDHGRTGLPQRGGMDRHKVTLTSQKAFSRGDSIGDIRGLVKISNIGSNDVTVTCN